PGERGGPAGPKSRAGGTAVDGNPKKETPGDSLRPLTSAGGLVRAEPLLIARGDNHFCLPVAGATGWLTVSPDGKLRAAPCGPAVTLFDAHTGRVIHNLGGPTKRIEQAAFSADGKLVACGSHDGTVHVWDTDTGKEQLVLTWPDTEIHGVA